VLPLDLEVQMKGESVEENSALPIFAVDISESNPEKYSDLWQDFDSLSRCPD
jgi:hypothetical protein